MRLVAIRYFKVFALIMLAASLMTLSVSTGVEASGQSNSSAPKSSTAKKKPRVKYYRVHANETFRVRLDQTLKSDSVHVGDTFTTTLVDPVYGGGGVEVIPVGSKITGRVTAVQKAQKDGKPGSITVGFYHVRLPNHRSVAMNGSLTDLSAGSTSSDTEGTATAKKTSKRNLKFIGGGAAGGALIGAIAGGGKGLAIGAGVGAGAGFIAKKLRKGKEAEVKSGTEFGVILNQPIALPAYRPS